MNLLSPEERIANLGLGLPPVPKPTGTYAGAIVVGNLVFVSGHAATDENGWIQGTIGREIGSDRARGIARQVTLNCLASLRAGIGSLSKVDRIVKILGMLRTTPEFMEHSTVMDGCTELLVDVFGEAGRAARSSVGMVSLPFGTPVEIEMVVATTNADTP